MVATRRNNVDEPTIPEPQARLYQMTSLILAALDVAETVAAEKRESFLDELSQDVIAAYKYWNAHDQQLFVHPQLLSCCAEFRLNFNDITKFDAKAVTSHDPRIMSYSPLKMSTDLGPENDGTNVPPWCSKYFSVNAKEQEEKAVVVKQEKKKASKPAALKADKKPPQASSTRAAAASAAKGRTKAAPKPTTAPSTKRKPVQGAGQKRGQTAASDSEDNADTSAPPAKRQKQSSSATKVDDGAEAQDSGMEGDDEKEDLETLSAKEIPIEELGPYNLCDKYVVAAVVGRDFPVGLLKSAVRCTYCTGKSKLHRCVIRMKKDDKDSDPTLNKNWTKCLRCQRASKPCSIAPMIKRPAEKQWQAARGLKGWLLALCFQLVARQRILAGLVPPNTPEDAVRMLRGCHPEQDTVFEGDSDSGYETDTASYGEIQHWNDLDESDQEPADIAEILMSSSKALDGAVPPPPIETDRLPDNDDKEADLPPPSTSQTEEIHQDNSSVFQPTTTTVTPLGQLKQPIPLFTWPSRGHNLKPAQEASQSTAPLRVQAKKSSGSLSFQGVFESDGQGRTKRFTSFRADKAKEVEYSRSVGGNIAVNQPDLEMLVDRAVNQRWAASIESTREELAKLVSDLKETIASSNTVRPHLGTGIQTLAEGDSLEPEAGDKVIYATPSQRGRSPCPTPLHSTHSPRPRRSPFSPEAGCFSLPPTEVEAQTGSLSDEVVPIPLPAPVAPAAVTDTNTGGSVAPIEDKRDATESSFSLPLSVPSSLVVAPTDHLVTATHEGSS